MAGMGLFSAVVASVSLLLTPTHAASRPVALVTAETSSEVLAVSLGKYGGKVLERVHLADPLMIAAPLHGPAVVVSPTGTVTLLAWRTLRPLKVFHAFRSPQVATIAPGGRFGYVADGGTGELVVIDLAHRKIVDRVHVGAMAHHLSFSPDGTRLWVALGETATTVVRLDTSNLREPRVVGRIHPPDGAHDVKFAPDGESVWISSPTAPTVSIYSADGRLLESAKAGRGPQHLAFSGGNALVSSGYSSSLESVSWRSPYHALHTAYAPYGSFNLATYGGFVVTSSLFTGEVSEYRASDLHRLWTAKVAPATRYVAISLWPDPLSSRTLRFGPGRAVRRFTLEEPKGVGLFRMEMPLGVQAAAVATVSGLAPQKVGNLAPQAHPCERRGRREVCSTPLEGDPGASPARATVRLVKTRGPAGRIRVSFLVSSR